jgi:hypothetical protein
MAIISNFKLVHIFYVLMATIFFWRDFSAQELILYTISFTKSHFSSALEFTLSSLVSPNIYQGRPASTREQDWQLMMPTLFILHPLP